MFWLILLPFLAGAQHESGTQNTISWSVTVNNKNLSSQYNLTAQIERVQDKQIKLPYLERATKKIE